MAELGEFSTSYFSTPSETLDPKLFEQRHLRSWVRNGILHILSDFLDKNFRHSELWARPWLAGSGVSYQWSAARLPADLDCLVGVDYENFRKANPEYMGLSDKEISSAINEKFHEDLSPQTADWNDYELTFYVNPGATDIRSIKPYAAYDLRYDEWTVPPDPSASPPNKPVWDTVAMNDARYAQEIHGRFKNALMEIPTARGNAVKKNIETRLDSALDQGVGLWDEIHGGRKIAFGPQGTGYDDFYNYRWQSAKKTGAYHLLREMKDYHKDRTAQKQSEVYGGELPDADTLIRRAATYRAG